MGKRTRAHWQGTTCSDQYTDTAVIASGDGSGWGSNSSCENQGSRARQGAQSGLGRGLTAIAGQGKLSRGHGLLSWQCERSGGSAVAVDGWRKQRRQ